ncbi:hypothetical protein D3C84_591960 [compost metagenome]
MLLDVDERPAPHLLTGLGDGPCEGENPAIKETGQAWACLAQSAIEVQQPGATTALAAELWRYRALIVDRVLTPGRGIDRDGGLYRGRL